MTTVVVYNNDVLVALRILKKDQQKEGTFKAVKSKKYHRSQTTRRNEKLATIVLRKMKEHKDKMLRLQTPDSVTARVTPFVFSHGIYTLRLFPNGMLKVYNKGGDLLKSLTVNEISEIDNILS